MIGQTRLWPRRTVKLQNQGSTRSLAQHRYQKDAGKAAHSGWLRVPAGHETYVEMSTEAIRPLRSTFRYPTVGKVRLAAVVQTFRDKRYIHSKPAIGRHFRASLYNVGIRATKGRRLRSAFRWRAFAVTVTTDCPCLQMSGTGWRGSS